MNETVPQTRPRRGLLVGIVTLVVLGILVAVVLSIYKSESESRAASIEPDTAQIGPNRIDAVGKIVSADPMKGDVVVRFEFTPQGTFSAGEDNTLTRDIDLFINSATGKQAYEFRKDKRMAPVEAVLSMYDGDAMDYPFDHHEAELILFFEPAAANTRSPALLAAVPEAEDAAAAADDDIPVAMELTGAVNGLAIEAEKAKENARDYVAVDLSISRATTAQFFSLFIMLAMWLLTLAVLFLVFNVLTDRRKIEIGMFSFLGALLFAFPALRNSQPGTPPIGTFGDFLAFFWAEILIALCLLTILGLWLFRGPGGSRA